LPSDRKRVARAGRLAAEEIHRDVRYAHTRELVVSHRGEAVVRERFGHGRPEGLPDTYSLTKSVVATLVGIALDRGSIGSLDDPVAAYLGAAVRHPYTVRQLLTMTGGTEPGGAWEIDEVMARPAGWVEHLLAAPPRRAPGAAFAYDNGLAHVLGAAVAAAVGMPLSRFAAAELFGPLGITEFRWPADPEGRDYGFGHLRLSALDLLALGELYLRGGEYGGRRVVSEAFVSDATRVHTPGGAPEHEGYAYLWWVAAEPVAHFFAAGYAGQSLTVVPELELVAVTIGAEESLRPGWRNARHAVIKAVGSIA
jgi:CubicO group peptidase (beta-lactamase class C family)